MKFYLTWFLSLYFILCTAFALQVTPDIGFRQSQSPNGAQMAPDSPYRTQLQDHHVEVGMDFTFDVG